MIRWETVPWTLWAYAILSVGAMVVVALTGAAGIALATFSIAFAILWSYFLLKGVRWLWIATLVLGLISIAINLATNTGSWYGNLVGLIGLVFLILPPTRQFFGRTEPATVG